MMFEEIKNDKIKTTTMERKEFYIVTDFELNEKTISHFLFNNKNINIISTHLGKIKMDEEDFKSFLKKVDSELVFGYEGYPENDESNIINL